MNSKGKIYLSGAKNFSFQIKCLQTWYTHWEQEVPEWVYAVLKCKPVFYGGMLTLYTRQGIEFISRTLRVYYGQPLMTFKNDPKH